MDAQVELAAEPAAAGGRDDPNLVRPEAEDERDLVTVHVWGLGADRELDPVAHPARNPGLGLDVRVLDEGRLDLDVRGQRRVGERGVDVAVCDPPADEHVPRRGVVEHRGIRCERLVQALQRGQRLPGDRQLVIADGHDRSRIAHEREHGLAAVSDNAVRQGGLVLASRIDAVPVLARHIGGRDDVDEARVSRAERTEVADLESRSRVRRPHGAQCEEPFRALVGPEACRAEDPRQPVDLRQPRADGGARLGGEGRHSPAARRGAAARVTRRGDGLQDLHVAGAAAEHAAEPVPDRRIVGIGVRGEERIGCHEHPGRADAALGGAVLEERRLDVAGQGSLLPAPPGGRSARPSTVRT